MSVTHNAFPNAGNGASTIRTPVRDRGRSSPNSGADPEDAISRSGHQGKYVAPSSNFGFMSLIHRHRSLTLSSSTIEQPNSHQHHHPPTRWWARRDRPYSCQTHSFSSCSVNARRKNIYKLDADDFRPSAGKGTSLRTRLAGLFSHLRAVPEHVSVKTLP